MCMWRTEVLDMNIGAGGGWNGQARTYNIRADAPPRGHMLRPLYGYDPEGSNSENNSTNSSQLTQSSEPLRRHVANNLRSTLCSFSMNMA